ncbi:MAG: DsbA family protein [Patescibacteria group bacterium]
MRWYQTLWGIALLGLGGMALLASVVFGVVTIRFWWQIKHGQGGLLQQQVYGGFDRSVKDSQGEKVDRAVLENGDFPFLGNPNASTTIVVFGDFRCPNTKNAMPIIKKMTDTYGYKLKVIFRNFPGESIHPGATRLAYVGVCAYDQGKYWNVSDYLFAKKDDLPVYLAPADMAALAGDTGLDLNKLNTCLDSSAASIKVNRDYADGYRFGVGGTPTFFVNGQKIEGVVPFDAWEGFVKQF